MATAAERRSLQFHRPGDRSERLFHAALRTPYEVVIDTHAPSPPVLNDISPDTGSSSTDGITDVNTPTFSGTTEPFAVVDLYSNGSAVPFGATEADISGFWSFTVGQPGQVTYPGALSSILSPVFGVLQGITSGPDRCGLGRPVQGITRVPVRCWLGARPAAGHHLGFRRRRCSGRRHLQRDGDGHGHRRHDERGVIDADGRHRHPGAAGAGRSPASAPSPPRAAPAVRQRRKT